MLISDILISRGTDTNKLQKGVKTQSYILCGRSGDLNPGLGEEGAGTQHEDNVDNSVNRVIQDRTK